jgi:hypothetical protein
VQQIFARPWDFATWVIEFICQYSNNGFSDGLAMAI